MSQQSDDHRRYPKIPVNLKLDSGIVYTLRGLAASYHTTQTHIVETALKRLFEFLDAGGQLPLFPPL